MFDRDIELVSVCDIDSMNLFLEQFYIGERIFIVYIIFILAMNT